MVYFIFLLVVVLDQWTKWLIRSNFTLGESQFLLEGIFSLTYIENRGAAFGLGQGNALLFAIVAVLVSIAMVYYYKKTKNSFALSLSTGLILGGAWGNLIDRVIKGSVTDMFNFQIWPVFNVADVAVCIGCLFLVFHIFKET